MQSDGTEDCDAVDVAVEHFPGEKEEGSVEENVEERSVEVAVIHQVLVDSCERIEHCESLILNVSIPCYI